MLLKRICGGECFLQHVFVLLIKNVCASFPEPPVYGCLSTFNSAFCYLPIGFLVHNFNIQYLSFELLPIPHFFHYIIASREFRRHVEGMTLPLFLINLYGCVIDLPNFFNFSKLTFIRGSLNHLLSD